MDARHPNPIEISLLFAISIVFRAVDPGTALAEMEPGPLEFESAADSREIRHSLFRLAVKIRVPDHDNDGIPTDSDNCPRNHNTDQLDIDLDGIGDVCDSDEDGDGVPEGTGAFPCIGRNNGACEDNCRRIPNRDQEDEDLDGIGDVCDHHPGCRSPRPKCRVWQDCRYAGGRCHTSPWSGEKRCGKPFDRDMDGIPDTCDLCPEQYDKQNSDRFPPPDGDGRGDACTDSDNDGLFDLEELEVGTDGFITDPGNPDTDGDGLLDGEELNAMRVLPNGKPYPYTSNPNLADSDGDGENDFVEMYGSDADPADPSRKPQLPKRK